MTTSWTVHDVRVTDVPTLDVVGGAKERTQSVNMEALIAGVVTLLALLICAVLIAVITVACLCVCVNKKG